MFGPIINFLILFPFSTACPSCFGNKNLSITSETFKLQIAPTRSPISLKQDRERKRRMKNMAKIGGFTAFGGGGATRPTVKTSLESVQE